VSNLRNQTNVSGRSGDAQFDKTNVLSQNPLGTSNFTEKEVSVHLSEPRVEKAVEYVRGPDNVRTETITHQVPVTVEKDIIHHQPVLEAVKLRHVPVQVESVQIGDQQTVEKQRSTVNIPQKETLTYVQPQAIRRETEVITQERIKESDIAGQTRVLSEKEDVSKLSQPRREVEHVKDQTRPLKAGIQIKEQPLQVGVQGVDVPAGGPTVVSGGSGPSSSTVQLNKDQIRTSSK